MNQQKQDGMKLEFNFGNKQYEFKYFREADKDNGIFLIELADDLLNRHTPRYFIICYKDQKVSFKAENDTDFDIKTAIVKSIMHLEPQS